MIKSQKQYLAAQDKIKMLKEAQAAPIQSHVPTVVAKAARGQTGELLAEIEKEVSEYETLKNQPGEEIPIASMEDLMSAPIRYRIAKNMTVEEFSRKVNVHSRQIARYETEEYRHTTIETLLKILKKLDVHLSGNLRV